LNLNNRKNVVNLEQIQYKFAIDRKLLGRRQAV